MARIVGLIKGMIQSHIGELRSLNSTFSNNFVVFALLLFGLQPKGNYFLSTLVGLLLFIPLCVGSFGHVPKERFLLLPLTMHDILVLRICGLLLSPPFWIATAILLLAGPRQRVLALMVIPAAILLNLAFALGHRLMLRLPMANPFRWIPDFPGSLGGLIRKNIREMFHTLDAYLALALSLFGTLYRLLAAKPSPDVGFGCSMLIALSLSTYAQSLFAAEGRAGLERYRMMPIRGWRLLLAKDLAFLGIVFILTLPLSPTSGLAGGVGALSIGHFASVSRKDPQVRWRFAAGTSAGVGFIQVVALAAAALLCYRVSPLWLMPFMAVLVGSLVVHGRQIERGQGLPST